MTDQTTTPRHDGWTPARQRLFLESLATHGLVRRAAAAAGMSHEAAYQLRHRYGGSLFQLGWDAALLLARAPLADQLMERAIDGQEDVTVRDDDGRTRTRSRHDNRLALSLLSRLDRFADDGHAAHADARIVAGAWDVFLDLVETAGDADALAAFLDARRPARTEASGPCQLRRGWEEEEEEEGKPDPDQWLRDAYLVWWSEAADEYVTNFPPPPGFSGRQNGDPAKAYAFNSDYERSLSALEAERHDELLTAQDDDIRDRSHKLRRRWFRIEDGEETPARGSDTMASEAPCSERAVAVS